MTITESAQAKVDSTLNGEGFLGIHLEGGGCSGYQIKLSPTTSLPADAKKLSETIFSDAISLELLSDAKMDWIDDPFSPTTTLKKKAKDSLGCETFDEFKVHLRQWWQDKQDGVFQNQSLKSWENWDDISAKDARNLIGLIS